MLKAIRVTLAIIFLMLSTLLFVDFTGVARGYLGWVTRLQLIPAVLSLSVVYLVLIFVLTFVFGRIYCSVICPLGILQDVITRIALWSDKIFKRRIANSYRKPSTALRISVLALFVTLFVAGFYSLAPATFAGLLEPFGAFGRIVHSFISPIWDAANNYLADKSTENGTYTFYQVHHPASVVAFITAAVTLAVIAVFSWWRGRDYCNTICPVGTILGYLSQYAIFKPVIDTSKCDGCSKCAGHCKASCINSRTHTIDYSRCVACMDCISTCPQKAISYSFAPLRQTGKMPIKASSVLPDPSRRSFLTVGTLISATIAAKAIDRSTLGGLIGETAPLKSRIAPPRDTRVLPPGAFSASNFSSHCIGCQLCVTACPENILLPSTSAEKFLQPELNFQNGYCRVECNACTEACPYGAILPITLPDKASTQIGVAVVDKDACLSASHSINCTACHIHCPTGAIMLVDDISRPGTTEPARIPVVDTSACIGCGACENYCPVGTVAQFKGDYPAIHVEGLETQHLI